jgi:GNAT superfamily N-acetyltransferase
MDHSVEHIEFVMVRDDLSHLPEAVLPAGYRIRTFQPGDERTWADIEVHAGEFSTIERGLNQFAREFAPYPDELAERMLFLESDAAGPIGTTSAWSGEHAGRMLGRIHWVALVPAVHGQGLSKPLLAEAMRILARHHHAAYLTTQTTSWRAAGLYRQFGFRPILDTPDAERAWAIVEQRLAASRR